MTGRSKSSRGISASGVPWTSPYEMRLKEMSIHTSSARGHGVSVSVDGVLVDGIDLRRLGHSSSRADLLGHLLEALEGTTGKVDLRSFAGEGAGSCATDRASRPVDHGVLVFEQHSSPPSPSGCWHLIRAYGNSP